jgi:alpha-beta hydrolase superfamily lysophospholipase
MAAFALIHGAADVGWYWHLVERELRARGHETTAPDLPCEDDTAGLAEYADTVARAGRLRGGDLIVVAQSFGGFTAPLVAAQLQARAIILVAGMIPVPGEKPADWPANTGLRQAIAEQCGPLLPRRVHAPDSRRTAWHRSRPDRRWPLRRAQPAQGTGRHACRLRSHPGVTSPTAENLDIDGRRMYGSRARIALSG